MKDLRAWLQEVEAIGELKRVEGVSPEVEIGVITEINCQRRGPALLFDRIQGYAAGFRLLTGAILNNSRLSLTLGYGDIRSDQELVDTLEDKMIEYERRAAEFLPRKVQRGSVQENSASGDQVDLTQFPAPKWHQNDGGRYLGTGCAVITRDPDTGTVNLGAYRLMLKDPKTVNLHISAAHHGAINIRKYHSRGEPAPVAVSLGHHPLFLVLAGISVPYAISEYQFVGAIMGEPVPVVQGEITGLPIPAHSEVVLEGFCPPGELGDEGPFGEYTGYYASGMGKEPLLRVKAVYHRKDPIILGALPSRPPHDYSYILSVLKSANVKAALKKDGIPEVKGVWYHESSGVNFFVVVSIRQRYPGHARQVGHMAAQCRAAGTSLGRYVVVVDDDIDPSDLDEVIWAIGTRSNPEKDIDLIRNTYSGPLDPIYPQKAKVAFGSRAVIDACKPYDWIGDFPQVAQSSKEERQKILQKYKNLFS